mgnify:CR=1 FL=1
MNNYTVYMHISPSNKRYIGITCKKPEYRWNNGNGYKKNIYFTNAINKYGWDNFQHIIIARGLTEEEAKWLEIELIREWNSSNKKYGYNISLGGESGNHSEESKKKMSENHADFRGKNHPNAKAVICITTNKIFNTTTEGAEYYGCLQGHVSNVCNGKENFAGKLLDGTPLVWMYLEDYEKVTEEEINKKIKDAEKLIKNRSNAKSVICITTNAVFYTAKDGGIYYNCGGSEILKCCKKRKSFKSAGKLPDGTKLVWRYIEIIEL